MIATHSGPRVRTETSCIVTDWVPQVKEEINKALVSKRQWIWFISWDHFCQPSIEWLMICIMHKILLQLAVSCIMVHVWSLSRKLFSPNEPLFTVAIICGIYISRYGILVPNIIRKKALHNVRSHFSCNTQRLSLRWSYRFWYILLKAKENCNSPSHSYGWDFVKLKLLEISLFLPLVISSSCKF